MGSREANVDRRAGAHSTIEAARAGAATAVQIEVCDPKTPQGSRNPAYREKVQRIRKSDVNPVINVLKANGNDLLLGGPASPLRLDAATDLVRALERLAYVEELRPEICTLACGSSNFGPQSEYIVVNSTGMLRATAGHMRELGVRPALELFDEGHLKLVNAFIKVGLTNDPSLIQLCMGIGYGAPIVSTKLMGPVQQLLPRAVYSTFSIGLTQLPICDLGADDRYERAVGLKDNMYLFRGRLAFAELVQGWRRFSRGSECE